MTTLRLVSQLPPELETLVRTTIGALVAVHRELGAGMNEGVYSAAARIELTARAIPFECEKAFPVKYRDRVLCHQRVDLLIDDRLIVEIKSVERLHPVHVAQTVGYLRLTGVRIGLLVNFNVPILKQGIRRVVV